MLVTVITVKILKLPHIMSTFTLFAKGKYNSFLYNSNKTNHTILVIDNDYPYLTDNIEVQSILHKI